MSGGHFDYIQYRIDDVAEQIERDAKRWADEYPPNVLALLQITADHIRLAAAMLNRVDWLLSDDDGPESFIIRWSKEGLPTVAPADVPAMVAALREVADLNGPLAGYAIGYRARAILSRIDGKSA